MAESAPINDVLCGAVEYLVKLGTNLRQRSEILKHKRIRKDRLRNTHAVQKAASKVLLLCELSKKSIRTVESSVETIMSQIASLQGNTNGGKSSSSENVSQYEYFMYNSKRLKIRNKVNIKHYTSAKVVASVMSTSMQDRYPVFYDCKLYRLRMKTLNHNSKTNVSERENDRNKESNSKTKISSDKKDVLERQNNKEKSVKFNDSIVICDENKDNRNQNVSNSSDKEREEDSTNTNTYEDDKSSRTIASENEDKNFRKRSKSRDVENDIKDTNESTESRKTYSQKTKKFKHIKLTIDDSSSDEEYRPKTDKKYKSSENIKTSDSKSVDVVENSVEQSFSGENGTSKELGKQSEITKTPIFLNKCDSNSKNVEKDKTSNGKSEESIKSIHHNETLNTGSEENESNTEGPKEGSSIENAANNIVVNKSFDSIDDDKEIQSEPNTKNYESDKSVESNASKKSFIKCVSISKLLKPDKIATLTSRQVNNDTYECSKGSKTNKIKSKDRITKRIHFSTSTSDSIIDMKTKNDEYWQQKRKEVKDFKAKKFTINITRLPKLTVEYLKSQNLKRIVQNESVICEITLIAKTSNFESYGNQSSIMTDRKNLHHTNDMVAIKNSLLNASDSEQTDEDIRQVNEIVKKSLLCESDSDKDNSSGSVRNVAIKSDDIPPDPSESSQNINNSDQEIPDTIENEVDNVNTHSSNEKSKSIERQSKEKELNVSNEANNKISDLADSHRILRTPDVTAELTSDIPEQDSLLLESIKTPDNKQQSVDSPPSKRKRIMESMHAKKMLLTYSSSSDTEDEHLRNTLKQIKNDLLKVDANSKDDKNSTSSESDKSSNNSKKSRGSSNDHSKSKRKKTSPVKDDSQPEDNSNSTSSKMDHSNGKSSSGDQHSNNEDSDKDINGLTNLKTLRKSRRRRSQDRSRWLRFRMAKMPKAPVISEEALLQPDSGSDVASVVSNEDCEVEELPRVPVMSLNGDGDILAKDDLLADSDSSTSQNQNKTSQDDKEGDSEEENLKAKRRKANAIASSDSEAGSSRRKDRRLSDFEDSEDDGLDSVKKSKRKKNRSESDSGSNDEGKKKRRRIKNIDDSEGSGSETENEGRNKHGRKNIRKVMGKNQLEEATKKAAREEKERIARIAERQKLYNNLQFDESGKPDEVVLDKVVLDFDPETKEPIIELDKGLVKKLKPHQANGIKFMWDACFESVKRIKKGKGSGCILAHCMGLGKTLQVVSLTHTLLTHSALTGVSRVLVVCPLSTVLNWVNEFKMWLKHTDADYEVDVYELSRYKQNSDRAFQLSQWFQHGGVCVLGYEMFRNLSSDSNKKFKKKMLKNFQEALVDPGPDLVVCDEGHLLKNEKTSLSQAMNKVKTLRRIVLTGTPLQNNLKEYYCMVQFVKPNLLGKYNEYLNRFVNPITNGQYTDSTEHDIKIMKRRSHVLHKMLDGAVQRRDYGVLAPFLPPKHEYVLFITLTEVQIKLYTHYLDNYSRRPLPGKSSGFLFPDFQSLQRIWTHPLVLKYNSERYEIMQQKKREREEEDSEGSLVDFIDDDSTPEESTSEESTDDSSDMSDDSRKKSKKKKSPKKSKGRSTRRGTRANPVEVEDDDVQEVVEVKNENPTEWWMSLVNEEELDDVRNSHKLVLLFDILRQCEAIGDKLLVFSQSLYSLDLIEHFLGKVDEATQEGRVDEKLGGHVGSWSPGVDYFRLDGSTSCENRSIWCKNFNREDNPRARLFLISTRAGGLGINLVAANRVVIFDVSWNPSHDVQSIFRVYRFGQKKPCYIYRFLVMGTMEEKIYERQVTKQAISKRVIDEQQIDRHYAENDLAELYKFEPEPPQPRPIPPLPKDRLFAEMLKEHEQLIYKYHEHDSLLENKEEETLTEEERKAAWEDFENEKTRPPPVPFTSPYAMHNGMMPGLLAQQQQLAYATVAAMLRKEAPTITENQIRDMMPLIYNANPQLMQKMSEMYKYPQSGMVNPGMMNAVMNPGGGGMPMGGSSGLQYEPPWQRQQQMRLQQLMQQQNQMGAKYYAGGLGSRDPVAMALQHQRAREMMLGERSRPRGRPPLHAPDSAPRPAPQDVVNLDSD